jgi:hypothetical protein
MESAVAATTFIAGYLGRWKRTPVAMLVIYGVMALVCAYQTFFILTSASAFAPWPSNTSSTR